VSNSSLSTAEITSEEFYLKKRIENCKQVLRETGSTQGAKIIEWAESLERLIEMGKI